MDRLKSYLKSKKNFIIAWRYIYRFSRRSKLVILFVMRWRFKQIYTDGYGIFYLIDPQNTLDQNLKNNKGIYNRLMESLFDESDTNSVAIDVGANAGYWTLPMARRFLRVLSFEPDSEMFQKLNQNLKLNPELSEKVDTFSNACSSESGHIGLNVRRAIDDDSLKNYGLSSIVIENRSTSNVIVKAVTLSDVRNEIIEKIGFIKIDVEGAESLVFEGARRVIEKDKPVIFWEAAISLDRKFNRKNVADSFSILSSYGYEHYFVNSEGRFQYIDDVIDFVANHYDTDIKSIARA